jgi:hypothetical protein
MTIVMSKPGELKTVHGARKQLGDGYKFITFSPSSANLTENGTGARVHG